MLVLLLKNYLLTNVLQWSKKGLKDKFRMSIQYLMEYGNTFQAYMKISVNMKSIMFIYLFIHIIFMASKKKNSCIAEEQTQRSFKLVHKYFT